MKCPVCNIELHVTVRQGIGIDNCPSCKGVWLDRRKLDQLLYKSPEFQNCNNARNYLKDKYLEHFEDNLLNQNDHEDKDNHYYENNKQFFDLNDVYKSRRKRKKGLLDLLDF